jgi:uncharacterized membrane protein YdbT with pleckstrin-like domain
MPKNLLAGESMVLQPLRKHWIVVVKGLWLPSLIGLVLLFIVFAIPSFIVSAIPSAGQAAADIRLLGTLIILVVWGAWAIVIYLQWSSASLTVTDQRVILEEGVFRRDSKVIALDRVQDVSTKQSLLGRVLRYGLVEIDAAGVQGAETFDYCRSPELLRDQVFMLSEQLRRG